MRPRTLVLILLALVLSGATAMLANAWLNAQRQTIVAEAPPPAPEPVQPKVERKVLVAQKALGTGTLLKPEDLSWQPWPDTANLDQGYILEGTKKPEDLTGWVVRTPFLAGEPIVEGRVISPGDRGFLAAVLKPGMRAVSITVTPTTDISGFVFPGDHVDLVLIHHLPQQAGVLNEQDHVARQAAETIEHNLRVLGIDQKVDSKAGEPVVAHTATLEVTEQEAEQITLAEEMGKLSLTLNGLGDDAVQVAALVTDPKPDAKPKGKPAAKPGTNNDHPAFTIKQKTSYTLDNQVSRLMPPFLAVGSGVTVIRGSGSSEDNGLNGTASAQQSAGNQPTGAPSAGKGAANAPKVGALISVPSQ